MKDTKIKYTFRRKNLVAFLQLLLKSSFWLLQLVIYWAGKTWKQMTRSETNSCLP